MEDKVGIIVVEFPFFGGDELIEKYGDKVKIADNRGVQYNFEDIDAAVATNDIVLLRSTPIMIEGLTRDHVNFDVFFPSIKRKGEMLERLVLNHVGFKSAQLYDKNFEESINYIKSVDLEFAHKHELKEKGEFMDGDKTLTDYINSIKTTHEQG